MLGHFTYCYGFIDVKHKLKMTPILTVVSDTLLKQLLQNIVVHDNTSLLPITFYIKH